MFKTVIENLPMVFSLLMGMGLIVLEVFLPGFGLPAYRASPWSAWERFWLPIISAC